MVFLIADWSAVLKSPVIIQHNRLLLRTGMRWRLLTSCDNVASAIKVKDSFEPGTDCFKGAITKGCINMHITFKQPVQVSRLYRNNVCVTQLAMSVDHADDFLAALYSGSIVH